MFSLNATQFYLSHGYNADFYEIKTGFSEKHCLRLNFKLNISYRNSEVIQLISL